VSFEVDGNYEWHEVVKLALSVNGFSLEEMPDKTYLIKQVRADKINRG